MQQEKPNQENSENIERENATLLSPEEYLQLISKLVLEGTAYGKTESVAAFPLKNLSLVDTKSKPYKKTQTDFVPHYVIFDLDTYPIKYAQYVMMKMTMKNYAEGTINEAGINAPDYKGPGIWTTKASRFNEDYIRREGVDEEGNKLCIYDPNPDAYRLCLKIDTPIYIPTEWGEPYYMAKGSTLAIREQELKKLIPLLENIQKGTVRIQETLFTTLPNGNIATTFDIYGMEPEFLENNYQEVKLHQNTTALIKKYKIAKKTSTSSFSHPLQTQAFDQQIDNIVSRYSFDHLDKDSVVLWSGGNSLFLPQEGKVISANSEIANAFLKVNNCLQNKIKYTDLARTLSLKQGQDSSILPPEINETGLFEEKAFWQKISQKFVLSAKGVIYVASNEARPTGNFRLYELDCIENNPHIKTVCELKGAIVKANTFPFVDLLSKEFNRAASYKKWKKFIKDNGIEKSKLVNSNLIFNKNLETLPKDQWLRQKRSEWFQSSKNKMMLHLNDAPLINTRPNSSGFYYDEISLDAVLCKANFISEAILAVEEYKQHEGMVNITRHNEKKDILNRLSEILYMFNNFPEILFIDEPFTALELKRSKLAQSSTSRLDIYSAKIGEMLLCLDNTLSPENKNKIWREQSKVEISQIVTAKISSLKTDILQILSDNSYILGSPNKPSLP